MPRWMTYCFRYAVGMGLYGFTRGYRATHQWDKSKGQFVPCPYLIGDQIGKGILTGVFYAIPYTIPWTLVKLLNRVEIRVRGWKPEDFPQEYEDGPGYCPTML